MENGNSEIPPKSQRSRKTKSSKAQAPTPTDKHRWDWTKLLCTIIGAVATVAVAAIAKVDFSGRPQLETGSIVGCERKLLVFEVINFEYSPRAQASRARLFFQIGESTITYPPNVAWMERSGTFSPQAFPFSLEKNATSFEINAWAFTDDDNSFMPCDFQPMYLDNLRDVDITFSCEPEGGELGTATIRISSCNGLENQTK